MASNRNSLFSPDPRISRIGDGGNPFAPKRSNHDPRFGGRNDCGAKRSRHDSPSSSMSDDAASSDFKCRLCKMKLFKTKEEFDYHLTVIHFREKIMAEIDLPPYKCKMCGFVPSTDDPVDELCMHYGCEENFGMKYYEEECQKMSAVKKELPPPPSKHGTTFVCKICDNPFDNERKFVRHITVRHFSSDLRQKLPKSEPFKCPFRDCHITKEDQHSLMLHYGWEHNVSMEFYFKHLKKMGIQQQQNLPTGILKTEKDSGELFILKDTTKDTYKPTTPAKSIREINMFNNSMPRPSPKPSPSQVTSNYTQSIYCNLCTSPKRMSFVNARSLKIHILFAHYFPKISDGGKDSVIQCPKCSQKFKLKADFAKHFLSLHFQEYAIEHQKMRRKKSSSSSSTAITTIDVLGSSPPPSSPDVVALDNSLREEMAKKRQDKRVPSDSPLPRAREMKTIHRPGGGGGGGPSSARQRMLDRWKSTSIDSDKYEVEQLKAQMETLKQQHAETLKQKAAEFERWISQKETVIEREVEEKVQAEQRLQEANANIADLNKQLEQKEDKVGTLESMLVEKDNRCDDLLGEKRELEKKLAAVSDSTSASSVVQDQLGKELVDIKSYLESQKTDSKKLQEKLNAKTEELGDLEAEFENYKKESEKQLAKVNKQLENLKVKHDKVTEEKKAKMAHIKEITKLHKEHETDQKNQITRLTKENEGLKRELEAPNAKEEEKSAKKLSALEQEKSDNQNSIKLLEGQRNALLESLERIQVILQGYETVIKDKNERLQDLSTKLEEAEVNLDAAMEKLSDAKTNDKEKKELSREVKQLKSTLKDWETRQFTNVKLISGLQKEKAALEKKVKDFEENNTGAADELYNLSSSLRKAERELKASRTAKDKLEQDLAKSKVYLQTKTSEVADLTMKCSTLEASNKQLEKEVRQASMSTAASDSDDVETLKNTLDRLSQKYAEVKSDLLKAQNELKAGVPIKRDDDEYTKALAQVESLKKIAKESQMKLHKKERQVEALKNMLETSRQLDAPSNTNDNSNSSPASHQPNEENGQLNNSINIKSEPPDNDDEEVETNNMVQVDTAREMILNVADSSYLVDQVYDFNEDEDDDNDDDNVDIETCDPLPRGVASISNGGSGKTGSQKGGGGKNKKKQAGATANSSSNKLEDVTDKYTREDEDDIVCGICLEYDPPLPSIDDLHSINNKKKKLTSYTTDWVGCDCGIWYHKQCTKLSRFTASFSCRSVKKKCSKTRKKRTTTTATSSKTNSKSNAITATESSSKNNSYSFGATTISPVTSRTLTPMSASSSSPMMDGNPIPLQSTTGGLMIMNPVTSPILPSEPPTLMRSFASLTPRRPIPTSISVMPPQEQAGAEAKSSSSPGGKGPLFILP